MKNAWESMILALPSVSDTKSTLSVEAKTQIQMAIESAFLKPIKSEFEPLRQSLYNLQFVLDQTWSQLDDFNKQRFKIALQTTIVSVLCLESIVLEDVKEWPSSETLDVPEW